MLEAPGTQPKGIKLARASGALPPEVALRHFVEEFSRERTFDNLSASLGDDKAKAVITSIGMAALSAAPELSGSGLGSVVTQTLARLTQQDLAGLARNESSAVGRAQAIVQEEVKAQKNAHMSANLSGASFGLSASGAHSSLFPSAPSGRANYQGNMSSSEKASGAGSEATSQQALLLGKLSGNEFAARLGFTGQQAKEIGALFAGTSGSFRSAAEDYKRTMDDANATAEQREEARRQMERAAKTKKEKEAARRFAEETEKMKASGVDLDNSAGMAEYRATHGDAEKILQQGKAYGDKKVDGKTEKQADAAVEAKVKLAVASAQKAEKKEAPQRAKPATIQSTL